ncbi:conserved hypothetical protein [Candidatus Koribacter versatilis Ellin345]|uniref:Uncharacterized protein n=1 Tax=Koribacter versatilis (strain Ellin345) TaxID=204669 RepID=Q1IPV6_KORVE|nr:hypothetical protein [Candidatus Koribacter versatilis]ABF41094.1 conserved hypothetical protein [Candidatus Koribacter versatilis Ellin345]
MTILARCLLVLVVAVAPLVVQAQTVDQKCKGNSEVVGACYVVHGRMQYTNGTPNLRIWVAGTKHYLGVTARSEADDAETPIVPQYIREKNLEFDDYLHGDFEVCPFTKEKSGAMTMVCVESASKLVLGKK